MNDTWLPALEHLDLLAAPTATALEAFAAENPDLAAQIEVIAIDPDLSDTATLVEAWDLPLASCVNCVIIAGSRSGQERVTACCVRADTRADVNHTVKKRLDVRKCSFMEMNQATARSAMEYGGITPIGLPEDWPVWLDAAAAELPSIIIGAGVRAAKLRLPGQVLAQFPNVEVVEALAN